jgi:DNA-binding CsgD family transcriptional regulator
VTTGAVPPITMGQVYCGVIEACEEIFDVGRAQEWTNALTAWCDRQSESVPYRGRCLVFRSELLTFHGDWVAAVEEAGRAHRHLAGPPPEPAVGEARYQQAELHRLRGEIDEAEAAYREAAEAGRPADPGLALLRLGQGRTDAAAAMIGRALDEALDPVRRLRLLAPLVEIALAHDDPATARAGADELAATVTPAGPPILATLTAWADGAVRLATGDAAEALPQLRRAARGWAELSAPYELARTRELIARACAAQGDRDAAAIERDAARRTFLELGARLDLVRLDGALGDSAGRGLLSARELEILREIAAGRTNREIAIALGISERTVDRHVSNIFAKLAVSSRSAATAWGYTHGLI